MAWDCWRKTCNDHVQLLQGFSAQDHRSTLLHSDIYLQNLKQLGSHIWGTTFIFWIKLMTGSGHFGAQFCDSGSSRPLSEGGPGHLLEVYACPLATVCVWRSITDWYFMINSPLYLILFFLPYYGVLFLKFLFTLGFSKQLFIVLLFTWDFSNVCQDAEFKISRRAVCLALPRDRRLTKTPTLPLFLETFHYQQNSNFYYLPVSPAKHYGKHIKYRHISLFARFSFLATIQSWWMLKNKK